MALHLQSHTHSLVLEKASGALLCGRNGLSISAALLDVSIIRDY